MATQIKVVRASGFRLSRASRRCICRRLFLARLPDSRPNTAVKSGILGKEAIGQQAPGPSGEGKAERTRLDDGSGVATRASTARESRWSARKIACAIRWYMKSHPALIDEFARLQTEQAMSRIVSAVTVEEFGVDDLCRLADSMGRSGAIIDISRDHPTADLASTGGPGSLSTLLAPLYLRAYGLFVPKLGVPGRPAGGIDVLAQIPGYRIKFSAPEVLEILLRCGYAHFLADVFAPLDAVFFRYRQRVGAQNVPTLAIASLLAKKIACGVKFAGLDVRVAPHGNFGASFGEARQAARIFCAAARVAGIEAVASLTDARTPYQPYIGRGESLLALRLIFDGRADAWLTEHIDLCRLMAAQAASLWSASRQPDGFDISKVFYENLEAQGSSKEAFFEKTNVLAAATRHELYASREGFLRVRIAGAAVYLRGGKFPEGCYGEISRRDWHDSPAKARDICAAR